MLAVKERTKKINIEFKAYQYEYLESLKKSRGGSVSSVLRELIDADRNAQERKMLELEAEALMDAYTNDKELTIFTSLDGEPFK